MGFDQDINAGSDCSRVLFQHDPQGNRCAVLVGLQTELQGPPTALGNKTCHNGTSQKRPRARLPVDKQYELPRRLAPALWQSSLGWTHG